MSASVTYTFTNGATADAGQVNQNFTDLVNYLNTNLMAADGSVAMTGLLSLYGSDPSSSNHATRKSYVDTRDTKAWMRVAAGSLTMNTVSAFNTTYYSTSSVTLTNPSIGALNIIAIGEITGSNIESNGWIHLGVGISTDGGSSYTAGPLYRVCSTDESQQWSGTPIAYATNTTPTGDIKVRLSYNQAAFGAAKASAAHANVVVFASGYSL